MKARTRRPSRYLIYGLLDPTTNELRYIGKTHKRRELRLQEHIERARNGEKTYVYNWIRRMLSKSQTPHIFVLERVPGASSWEEAERRHIQFWDSLSPDDFPIKYPPMTPKSEAVSILGVRLTNRAQIVIRSTI